MEYDLIKSELKEIDVQLERAETELNWNSDGELALLLITGILF